MPVLNSQAVANAYPSNQPGAIISGVWNSRGGWFSVTGATAFVQLQYGDRGSEEWAEEIFLGAGAFVILPPNCRGLRFRNGVANVVATVTAQIAQGEEPPLAISTIGQTNTVLVSSLNFQDSGVAVGTEPTLNLIDVAGVIAWTMVDNVAQTRVDVTPAFTSPALFPGNVGVGGNAGDTAISRLAAGVLGITTAFSTGPTVATAGGGGTAGIYHGASLNMVTAAAATIVQQSSITTDTAARFTQAASGAMTWGPGGAAATDTTLQRLGAGRLGLGVNSPSQDGRLDINSANTANTALVVHQNGESNNRLVALGDGSLNWGSGSAALDTVLARTGVGHLDTGNILTTGGSTFGAGAAAGIYVDGAGRVQSNAAANLGWLTSAIVADSQFRFVVDSNGVHSWGTGAAARDVQLGRVVNSSTGTGSFLELTLGDGFGYGTGTGGTVTQITSLTTGVTLNKPTGKITTFNSALAGGLDVQFTVTNSVVGANDVVVLTWDTIVQAGVPIWCSDVAAGSFKINYHNLGALSAAQANVINFAVIKGASA